MKLRQVRRAQTLSPFGVGAILDVEGESFVAADIYRWRSQGVTIHEPRLEETLGVDFFRMAPAAPSSRWEAARTEQGVPYYRFPQWLFCQHCRLMYRWSYKKETGDPPVCDRCSKSPRLVPMRFVMACPRGHLADMDWARWAHSRKSGKCENATLEFLTRPGGSGLDFVSVRCRACGAERTLEGIASPDSMKALGVHCPGRQPWQMPSEGHPCDAVPQVVQRGATNLTFANVVSSIDIPPFSNWSHYSNICLQIANEPEFSVLMSSPGGPMATMLIEAIASKLETDVATVQRCVDSQVENGNADQSHAATGSKSLDRLYLEEYRAFLAPDAAGDPRDHFIKRFVDLAPYLQQASREAFGAAITMTGSRLDALAQAIRLREVRALTGFSRLAPSEGDAEEGESPGRFSLYGSPRKIAAQPVPSNLGPTRPDNRWLSAVEVFGEGIFLTLDERELEAWEQRQSVEERIQILAERHAAAGMSMKTPTPRLVLLHTLAHLLIRRLSFECGYSIASLRERIYTQTPDEGEPMSGLLIYTAAGDSEGTLGGLVREGGAARLLPTIVKALQDADWCSSDPLCRESQGQGFNAMNLAACHACTLIPETSCTFANRMLDRVVLLGTGDSPETGFFGDVMQQIIATLGSDYQGG